MHSYERSQSRHGRRQWRLALMLLLSLCLTLQATAFEPDQRINSLRLQFVNDFFAPNNAFGAAFVHSTVQTAITTEITNRVASGACSLLLQPIQLVDITGTNEPAFFIGSVNGAPVLPANNPSVYSGTSDLDWWYAANTNELDASALPAKRLPAFILSRVLNAGPGPLSFIPSPLGNGRLDLSDAQLIAWTGPLSAPLQSTNGFPPGHLPSENISPTLLSFGSLTSGKLKGNISAASLASTPIPASLLSLLPGFTNTHSLLDLLVCGARIAYIPAVNPTQPDQTNPNAPAVGAGPPYTFVTNATSKVVVGAKDKNGATVDLTTVLNAAAYSVFFTFTSDRVIVQPQPSALVVEQPVGTNLFDGTALVDFGVLQAPGSSLSHVFTVRNAGRVTIRELAVRKDGPNSSAFTLDTSKLASILEPGTGTRFAVRFSSSTTLVATAAIHLSGSAPGQTPFDIALAATAISATQDSDSDGLNDWAEYQMAPLGFNWQSNQSALVSTLFTNASTAGLYTSNQLQTLNLNAPLLSRDPATGTFTLRIGLSQSTNLVDFQPFPFSAPATTVNAQGQVQFQFSAPSNAAFFRLQAQ